MAINSRLWLLTVIRGRRIKIKKDNIAFDGEKQDGSLKCIIFLWLQIKTKAKSS